MINLGPADQVAQGAAKEFEVCGKRIAVFAIEGTYLAIDAVCPHRGGPLAQGLIEGHSVYCPWHGWAFDLTNGTRLNGPAARVGCHRVVVSGGELLVELA